MRKYKNIVFSTQYESVAVVFPPAQRDALHSPHTLYIYIHTREIHKHIPIQKQNWACITCALPARAEAIGLGRKGVDIAKVDENRCAWGEGKVGVYVFSVFVGVHGVYVCLMVR